MALVVVVSPPLVLMAPTLARPPFAVMGGYEETVDGDDGTLVGDWWTTRSASAAWSSGGMALSMCWSCYARRVHRGAHRRSWISELRAPTCAASRGDPCRLEPPPIWTSVAHAPVAFGLAPPPVATSVGVRHMPDEAFLREKARAVVQAGKLPARRPDRTWGGPGVGAPCAVCELPVTQNEMEFEIQFAHDGGLDKFHVHIRCFAAWEFERRNA